MTRQDKRNAAIKKAIAEYSKKALVSAETARASLIASGIYTESGQLKPEYGGEKIS